MRIVSLGTSYIDYPGVDSVIIGLAGCNFRCPYCQNPELVNGNNKNLPDIKMQEVEQYLQKKKKWIEGVVITGGEPTINPDLPELVDKIKELGFLLKLDTNGSNPDMLEKLINKNKLDYIAMDIKAPYMMYEDIARMHVNMGDINRSIDIIRKSGKGYELRTTCVPGLISNSMLVSICLWLENSEKYVLQNFRPGNCLDKKLNGVRSFTELEMDDLRETVRPYFQKVEVRYNTNVDVDAAVPVLE